MALGSWEQREQLQLRHRSSIFHGISWWKRDVTCHVRRRVSSALRSGMDPFWILAKIARRPAYSAAYSAGPLFQLRLFILASAGRPKSLEPQRVQGHPDFAAFHQAHVSSWTTETCLRNSNALGGYATIRGRDRHPPREGGYFGTDRSAVSAVAGCSWWR